MEAFMRILASAIALAVTLAWPTFGEAQSSKSTARSKATTTQQKVVHKKKTTHVRTAARAPSRTQRPCAGYLWWGCVGWDPDPNVRSSLVRDLADTP
jgi:hypothetical protein